MIRIALITVVLLFFFNCKEKQNRNDAALSADEIIDKSIADAGGDLFDQSQINFDFRDIHYTATRNHGKFQLERHIRKTDTLIRDVLNNSGFERFENGQKLQLSDSLTALYSASVNSVHYFSVLPYGLNDKAVHKSYLGLSAIKDVDYHKIKVTFSEEGGGEDFDDEFIYWINKAHFTIDYLAYSFKEKEGLGYRFREAYNARSINGLRFVDYNNYKPDSTATIKVEDLDTLFSAGKLELLSKIELENIEVETLN